MQMHLAKKVRREMMWYTFIKDGQVKYLVLLFCYILVYSERLLQKHVFVDGISIYINSWSMVSNCSQLISGSVSSSQLYEIIKAHFMPFSVRYYTRIQYFIKTRILSSLLILSFVILKNSLWWNNKFGIIRLSVRFNNTNKSSF